MSESIILSLNARWKPRDFAPGLGLAAGAHLPDYDDADWHPASVPGDVHTTLRVATDVYAYFVKLVVPIDGTRYSDDYSYLLAREDRGIEAWNAAGRRLEENDIRVSCL